MKICHMCKSEKDITEFGKNRASFDGLQSRCRICDRIRGKAYYRGSPVQQKAALVRNKERTEEFQNRICSYLSNHPCVDCGECDIVTLEFDHEDPKSKKAAVGELLRYRHSWKVIEAEIAKCQVRCANCHRKRTAKQFGSYRLTVRSIVKD